MLKTINQKDLTNLKSMKDYIDEKNVSMSELTSKVSEIIFKQITAEEIKNAINNANNLKSTNEDIEIVEALLEILYEEKYIDKPVHLQIEEEKLNNLAQHIEDKTEEDTVLKQSIKINQGKQEETITKNEKNIWLSMFLGLIVFGVYALYSDYKQDNIIQEKLEEEIKKNKNSKNEIEILEKRIKDINRSLRKETLVIEKYKKEIYSLKIKKDKVQKELSELKKKNEEEKLEKKKIYENGLKNNILAQKEKILEKYEEYEKNINKSKENKKDIRRKIKKEVKKAIEKTENKLLQNQKNEINQKRSEGQLYYVDQNDRRSFLKNCFEYYNNADNKYQSYCLCLSNVIEVNKIKYTNINKLLNKHRESSKYPNVVYIGSYSTEILPEEESIETRAKTCYEELKKTKKINQFKLNY